MRTLLNHFAFVESLFTDKIEWYLDNVKIKTKYNVIGPFLRHLKWRIYTEKVWILNCWALVEKLPNLTSLNKAKRLYQDGKPFTPDLDDFLEMLYFYNEVEFWYKGLNCCLFLTDNPQGKIDFGWSPENGYYFSDKEDFIQNAKIGDEYVRDIWDKVENPEYI